MAETIRVGDTYPVKERSLQDLIAERANAPDMEDKLKNYTKSFEAGIEIPAALVDKTFEYTPWYTLPEPIKDGNNQTLFPKGFRFNPLTKVTAPGRLVFFNEAQIDWVKSVYQAGDNLVMTAGDVYTAMQTLQARVFLLDAKTHDRLQIEAVPRIYEQKPDTDYFTVTQYAL
tara:strand:+ start:23504 stop:24019 length:516 start_codon:yes stop_codon:yes gene_type:complete